MSTKAKYLLSVLIGSVLSLGLVVPSASATTAALPVLGDSGATVSRMQEALIARGFTLKGGADGVFSASTQSTLKSFQKVAGFKATGRLDAAGCQSRQHLLPPVYLRWLRPPTCS